MPSGKLERKGPPAVEEVQVRSLWGLVGKSEMRSTGPAAAKDVLAPTGASSGKGRVGKTVSVDKREILHVLRQHSDSVPKDEPL